MVASPLPLLAPNNCAAPVGIRDMNQLPVKPSRRAKAMIEPYVWAKGQKTSWSTPARKKEDQRVLMGPMRSATAPAKIWGSESSQR